MTSSCEFQVDHRRLMSARHRLGVALVAAAAACPQEAKNCSLANCAAWDQSSWQSAFSLGGHAFEVGPVDVGMDCLRCYETSLHEMMLTLENLYFGQAHTYAFTDIVRNTIASEESNKCNLQVHELEVDLLLELDHIRKDVVQPAIERAGLHDAEPDSISVEELSCKLHQPSGVSALDFHSSLNMLFNRLQDAHTLYSFRSSSFEMLPVNFGLAACEGAGFQGRLFTVQAAAAPVAQKMLRLESRSQVLSSTEPRTVLRIDGRDPLEWLQEIADYTGTYHDKGQRLNDLVLGLGLLGGSMDGLVLLPGWRGPALTQIQATVEIAFADGKVEKVNWVAALNDDAARSAFTALGADYVRLHEDDVRRAKWQDQRRSECDAIPDCPQKSGRGAAAARAYHRDLGHLGDLLEAAAALEAPQPKTAPRLATPPGVGSPGDSKPVLQHTRRGEEFGCNRSTLLPSVGDHQGIEVVYAGDNKSEFVTASIIGDMAIYKLTSFANEGNIMDTVQQAVTAFIKLSDASREQGVSRVLVDIIGNGGGLVWLTDLLQSLFLKQHNAKKECNPYNKRVSEYWRQWVLSFGAGLDSSIEHHLKEMQRVAATTSLDVVRWYAKWTLTYLAGVVNTTSFLLKKPEISEEYTFTDSIVKGWINGVNNASDKATIIGIAERAFREHAFVPQSLYGSQSDGKQGWFPFTGDEIVDRETLKAFPHMRSILEPEMQFWGGTPSFYSKRGVFEAGFGGGCVTASVSNIRGLYNSEMISEWSKVRLLGLHDTQDARQHPWEEIAMVSDGTSGSAGSAFPSKLMASGYVTMFSYGGNGEPMDTSAFAGGNVLEYDSWWPKAAIAAEMGMWLNPDSDWEKFAKAMDFGGDGPAVPYPRPMPLASASARFNFNIMYIDEVSTSTSLPRQYYRFPAHKHFDMWPRYLVNTCNNPRGLLGLYKAIYETNWWEARRRPQYQDGWSGKCIPSKRKRCCCSQKAKCKTPPSHQWPLKGPASQSLPTCPAALMQFV